MRSISAAMSGLGGAIGSGCMRSRGDVGDDGMAAGWGDRWRGGQNGARPAPLAAFSIGTAKPMPMKVRASVGLRMAVTMPTTSPSIVTSGPPELPGLAAASNWIRLVERALAVGRAVLALEAGDDAGRHRRPDAEREADRHHLVARRQVLGRAQRGGDEVVGQRLRLQHGEVVLGLHRRPPTACDSVPSAKVTVSDSLPATTCRLVRMTPLSTMTTPVPTLRSTSRPVAVAEAAPAGAPLSSWCEPRTSTTDGRTAS